VADGAFYSRKAGVALPEVFTMGTKARVEPPAVDPNRVQAILDADKPK
jgi:hypothetical protein